MRSSSVGVAICDSLSRATIASMVRLLVLLTTISLLCCACGQKTTEAGTSASTKVVGSPAQIKQSKTGPSEEQCGAVEPTDTATQVQQGGSSAACFKLQPGGTVVNKKGQRVRRRCQPQSLIYARCRTGIQTCRLGDTSPVQWYACARKKGNVTARPTTGSVIVLDGNKRRRMPTGHPAYVEEARQNANGTWNLRLSHTNYDRKCHLDQNAETLYNPKTQTLAFLSGHWKSWAKDLKVLGFILR